ncbi:MAG: prepilin-type N-terminal cleavage/methylation domain-containing protein [Candidatus Kerfeldbacteria bacterium]|nr:prepilin-type N-terminal cleavage/methylation domain-containing protein [Candidatus Kerfeldbacteria bacterium]
MPKNSATRGFTLLEMVVYISIFATVVVVLTTITLTILSTKNQTRASRITYEESRFILERINNRIRIAPGMDTGNSVFGQSPGKIVLKSPVAETNLTTIELVDGVVVETIAGDEPSALSSADVEVTDLLFTLVRSSEIENTIQTSITIRFRNENRKDLYAETALTTQASFRNDFPYSWIQTDWSGGGGQDVWSNPTQFLANADAHLDNTSCPGDARLANNPDEIVIHVADVCDFHGFFHLQEDVTGAEGVRMEDMPNLGARVGGYSGNAADSNPSNYFDTTFKAQSGKLYHIWARMKVAADSDFGTSDSMYIQFNDSLENGDPVNRIGTSQGLVVGNRLQTWVWNDMRTGGIENTGNIITFEQNGDHTLRVQRREDGAALDQIILSSVAYINSKPPNGAIFPEMHESPAEIISSKFDAGDASVFGQLKWSAYTPSGTSVKFQLRSSDSSSTLDSEAWQGPTDPSDYYTMSDVGVNALHDGDRWIQYRALLESTTAAETPMLNSVSLSYSN